MLTYTTSQTTSDLKQILDLQQKNLEINISNNELQKEGFVTVNHDLEILQEMNHPFQHVIAKDNNQIVAYTLVMLKSMEKKIPLLISMFQKINKLSYQGNSLAASEYFVMGQVCIKKGYRGKGVFKGLYQEMKKQMASSFKYIITEVATRNQRSIRAHQKVGFVSILTYEDSKEKWDILLWDWGTQA